MSTPEGALAGSPGVGAWNGDRGEASFSVGDPFTTKDMNSKRYLVSAGTFASGVAALWAAACGAVLESPESADGSIADAAVADQDSQNDAGSADAALFCRFENDRCVGAPNCCPIRGRRIREMGPDAACVEPVKAVDCDSTIPPAEDDCVYSTTNGCYYRLVDGGREVYLTGHVWPEDALGGVMECDREALALRMRTQGLCK